MKKLGMIGGMSPESTGHYYHIINKIVCDRLGGNNSAEILMSSVNLQEIVDFMNVNDWSSVKKIMTREAVLLEPHVDAIIICTNTIHKIASDVARAIDVPLIHIGKVAAEYVRSQLPDQKVGLLGTSFTMKEDFLKDPFFMAGVDTIVPSDGEMEIIDKIIFQELCKGVVNEKSKEEVIGIINKLQERGAKGIVLACTELQMLIKEDELQIPIFDTMRIHAEAAAEFILKKEETPLDIELIVKTESGATYLFGPEDEEGVRRVLTNSKIPLICNQCKIMTLAVGKRLDLDYYPRPGNEYRHAGVVVSIEEL